MAHDLAPPFLTSLSTFLAFTLLFVVGKIRDLIEGTRRGGRKGYAPLREAQEDFYKRRLYGRIEDLWNRPIASAPDAWIDVMDRDDLTHCCGGLKQLEVKGSTTHALNLGSYNYLGFAAADEYCTPRVLDTLRELGVSTCSARAAAGTTPVHTELETMLAAFLGKPAAITLGMGFATNSAAIPALVGKGCLALSDSLNHSSIVAGVRLSGAKVVVFNHNDPAHLERILRDAVAYGQPRTRRPWRKILVIVEGIYSMEGEVCRLPEIVAVKKKYGAYLYLDEAHSVGAMGPTGRGVCEHCGVDPADVDIMMGTFTKSFGSCGGYIAADHHIIDYLRRNLPAQLYSAAMAPPAVQQVVSALKLLNGDDGTTRGRDKVTHLHANANYFRRRLMDMGLHVLGDWDSPVMPVMVYHPGKLPAISRMCLARGVAMVMVGFPATPLLLTRARVCISAAHSETDLEHGLAVLSEVTGVCMAKYGLESPVPEPAPHPRLPQNVPRRGITSLGELLAQVKAGAVNGKHKNGKAAVNGKGVTNGVAAAAANGHTNGYH